MDPSLVWNGAGYGLAWEDERDGHGEIYFARLNPWGRKIGEDVRVSQATYPNGPSLVWTGTGYGVVWREWSCGGDEIRFARLDASGNKLNPEVEVKHACYLLHPSLAWNGSQYGVVWEDACDSPGNDMDVYFTRLDSTGDTLGDVARITYQPSDLKYPSPVWADSEYGVAWSGDTKMYLTRLTALGYKIGDYQLSSDVSDMSYANRSSLVWTGTQYGVAWADMRDGNPEIYFARMECSCNDADDDNDGFSGCDGDCDDQDPDSYPNAPELCDGNNNDCNETIPSDEIDHDGDQYVECQGWNDIQGDNPEILGGGDCDPSNPQAYPGAPEICDEADNNCSDLQDLNDPELIADFDSDGDGLPDCWELHGLDVNDPDLICRSATPTDCDLPLHIVPYRANRTRKDIYVEVDYMDCAEGGCAPDHDPSQTHRPLNSTLSNAVAAFANHGIDLHFIGSQGMVDDPIPEIEPILFGPSSGPGPADDFWDLKWGSQQPQDPCTVGPTGAHFGTIADRTAPNCIDRIDARRLVFRYAIAGHSSPSGGGRAEINGNDLLLGLGGAHKARAARDVAQHWGTTFEKEWLDMEAGILMHELGHTLNLHHGGSDSSGNPVESPGCKPNHLSVMNFARVWNLAGLSVGLSGLPDGTPVRAKRKLDYSPEILPPVPSTPGELDESALDENLGVQGPSGDRVIFGGDASGQPRIARASGPIDWNVNGSIDGGLVSRDLNFIDWGSSSAGCPQSPDEILPGSDEWNALGLAVPVTPTIVDTPPLTALPTDVAFPQIEPAYLDYLNGALGGADVDGDGTANADDACPLTPDPGGLNADADAYGDACDCLPDDADQWAAPSEVPRLEIPDKTTIRWIQPLYFGANALVYDVIRSTNRTFSTGMTCVETNDGTDVQAVDAEVPPIGGEFYYLVRAESGCPDGLGPLGYTSWGYPRSVPDCQ